MKSHSCQYSVIDEVMYANVEAKPNRKPLQRIRAKKNQQQEHKNDWSIKFGCCYLVLFVGWSVSSLLFLCVSFGDPKFLFSLP